MAREESGEGLEGWRYKPAGARPITANHSQRRSRPARSRSGEILSPNLRSPGPLTRSPWSTALAVQSPFAGDPERDLRPSSCRPRVSPQFPPLLPPCHWPRALVQSSRPAAIRSRTDASLLAALGLARAHAAHGWARPPARRRRVRPQPTAGCTAHPSQLLAPLPIRGRTLAHASPTPPLAAPDVHAHLTHPSSPHRWGALTLVFAAAGAIERTSPRPTTQRVIDTGPLAAASVLPAQFFLLISRAPRRVPRDRRACAASNCSRSASPPACLSTLLCSQNKWRSPRGQIAAR